MVCKWTTLQPGSKVRISELSDSVLWGGTKSNQSEERARVGLKQCKLIQDGGVELHPGWLSLSSDYRGVSLSLKRERDYPNLIPTLMKIPWDPSVQKME